MDRYSNEKLKKYRDGTPDRLRDGSLHPSPAAPRRAPCGRQKPSIRAAFAIAYMAARASEHLTRLIRRDRAESLVTQSDRLLSAHF